MQHLKNILLLMLVVMSLALPSLLLAQDDTSEKHIQTIQRITAEAFNAGDLDVVDELFADDYVSYDPTGAEGDRESFKAFVSAFREAMPDFEATVDLFVVNGDWMAFRFTSTGTFENEHAFFPGVLPNNKTVELVVHVILRFNEDGQLVEEWDMWDNLALLTQLGVIPSMEESS